MNKLILMGRLTKEPEVRYTQTGKVVCSVNIAVNRNFKNAEGKYDADFFYVLIWGKAAELVGNSCIKGHKLLVEGSLQNRTYDDKQGIKRYITEVIASNVEFIERRDNQSDYNVARPGELANNASPRSKNNVRQGEFQEFGSELAFDEEIPF